MIVKNIKMALTMSNYSCRVLGTEESSSQTTLDSVRGSCAYALFDCWTTRCTRCPAALDKLDSLAQWARSTHNVQFISINLDNHSKAGEIVEGKWQNMKHVSVDEDTREALKELLGMVSVPFYALVDGETSKIIIAGSPSVVRVEALGDLLCQDLENRQPPTSIADPAGGCVGDSCPLPRRQRRPVVETVEVRQHQAPFTPLAQRPNTTSSECTGESCPLPSRLRRTVVDIRKPLAPSSPSTMNTPPNTPAPERKPASFDTGSHNRVVASSMLQQVAQSVTFTLDEDF